MFFKWWRRLIWIALMLTVQEAFTREGWLLIASDPPSAVVSVDNVYRGTTPQRLGDALRIRVPEGTRLVEVRKPINGKKCVARKTVEVTGEKENFVQFNLHKKEASAPITPVTPPVQDGQPQLGTIIPLGELEVPGRNF